MYRSTANLRFEKFPFRAVCGGNIAFHRSVFDRAGEFDEEFRAWGKEDTEWGFRVWNKGEYIIPVYEACGLHQEPEGGRNETDRELGLEEVMPIIYTPTVGNACERFSQIYRKSRGLFVSYPNRHNLDDMLQNATRRKVKVIVVTDGPSAAIPPSPRELTQGAFAP